jgi:hypothetical protein
MQPKKGGEFTQLHTKKTICFITPRQSCSTLDQRERAYEGKISTGLGLPVGESPVQSRRDVLERCPI